MERDSTVGEARARYTTAAIAGTVMMLSDDYGNPEAVKRALQFAGNRKINELAAQGVAFCPVEAADSSAANAYTAKIEGKQYLALFHWKKGTETVRINCGRAGISTGSKYRDLWTGTEFCDEKGEIGWTANGCDAVILEEI